MFLYSHAGKSYVYFSSRFNLLFYFMLLFLDRKDSLIGVWTCILLFQYFPQTELYTRRYVRRAGFFSLFFFCFLVLFFCCCCYILVVLTAHLFKNANVFYFVTWSMFRTFETQIFEAMTLLCKDKVLSFEHIKTHFYWSSKTQMLRLRSKLSVKIKRSEYFSVNQDMQKWSFWKLSKERSFPGKKLLIKICDCGCSLDLI